MGNHLLIYIMITEILPQLVEVFSYGFMVRGIVAGLFVSIIAPIIGMYLVVKRYSLLAETLAHISLVGVAGGLLLGVSPFWGALLVSIITGISVEKLRESKKIFSESILAIFLSTGLAVMLILFSLGSGVGFNVLNYLFGSITTVSSEELYAIVFLSVFGVGIVMLFRKKLFLVTYDEEFAKSNGIATKAYNLLLIILSAITVTLSIRVVGALLIGALMIIPVVSAMQYRFGFSKTMKLSIMFSVISVLVGIFTSFYMDLPASATIVLVLMLFFVLSLFVNKFLLKGNK